jgi:hypothetical protein
MPSAILNVITREPQFYINAWVSSAIGSAAVELELERMGFEPFI